MRILRTQVVIVGGGAAGCYAALNLHRKGIKTIIVCKGLVGKSGASLFAGNLVLSGRTLGNTEEQARNTAEFLIKYHNQFLIDQELAKQCMQLVRRLAACALRDEIVLFMKLVQQALRLFVAAETDGKATGDARHECRTEQDVARRGGKRAGTSDYKQPALPVDCLSGLDDREKQSAKLSQVSALIASQIDHQPSGVRFIKQLGKCCRPFPELRVWWITIE